MKILIVSEYFPPKVMGGGEISAELLAKGLSKIGMEVSVLTSWLPGLKRFEKTKELTIYRRLKTNANPYSIVGNIKRQLFFQASLKKELNLLLNEQKFQAIHFLNTTSIPQFKVKGRTIATINGYFNFCPKANLLYKDKEVCAGCSPAKYLSCMLGSNQIGKAKLHWYLKFNPLFLPYLYLNFLKRNSALKNIDGFISISDFITSLLLRNASGHSRIFKAPNIFSLEHKRIRGKQLDFGRKQVVVAYFGALEKYKGVELLIKAFNRLNLQNAKLIIAGEGSKKQEFEKIANENVFFIGAMSREHLQQAYERADIVVLPSLWPEPFSRVCLESSFFGKPLIATAVGGNVEGVIDGFNGFLVKPTVELLAQKIRQLATDAKLRKKFSRNAKLLYDKKFNSKNSIQKIASHIEQIASGRNLKLKILMATPTYLPTLGGREVQIKLLAEKLAEEGNRVHLLAPALPFAKEEQESEHLSVKRGYSFNDVLNPAEHYKFAKAIWKLKPDIVHVHFALPAGLFARIWCPLFKIPYVVTSGGYDIQVNKSLGYGSRINPLKNILVKWVLSKSAAHIVVSESMRKDAIFAGSQPSKIKKILNAADVGTVPPLKQSSKPIILSISRLHKKKGINYLIDAFGEIKTKIPNAELWIAGDGEEMPALKLQAQQSGFSESIKFLGSVYAQDEKLSLIKRCSVFCLPSLIEGLPGALFEPMLAQRPIVATSIGGINEVIEHKKEGILVRPAASNELAGAIIKLLKDKKFAAKLSLRARAKIIAKFNSKRLVDEHTALYNTLVRVA